MKLENYGSSETEIIAREVIEDKELTPQDKMGAAEHLERVAATIKRRVKASMGGEQSILSDWLRDFPQRGGCQ